jgi:nucleotide-binding universal stress UspA family protein
MAGPYKNILVGTDGSATAAIAVDKAIEVAVATSAALTVFSAGKSPKADDVVAAALARVKMAGIKKAVGKAVDAPAAEALVAEAVNGGYDLLVLGNKGMQGIGRFTSNSVPNKVTKMSPCAMLIVRTT